MDGIVTKPNSVHWKRPSWYRRRTGLERRLLCLSVILGFVALSLVAVLMNELMTDRKGEIVYLSYINTTFQIAKHFYHRHVVCDKVHLMWLVGRPYFKGSLGTFGERARASLKNLCQQSLMAFVNKSFSFLSKLFTDYVDLV